jgi:hypothetical protein
MARMQRWVWVVAIVVGLFDLGQIQIPNASAMACPEVAGRQASRACAASAVSNQYAGPCAGAPSHGLDYQPVRQNARSPTTAPCRSFNPHFSPGFGELCVSPFEFIIHNSSFIILEW